MGMFKKMTSDGMEKSEDRVGGGFQPFESDVYDAKIKLAYVSQSKKGAMAVNLHAEIDGKELREAIYVTNKEGDNFYLSKDGKNTKHPLPGFTLVDELCILATEGEALSDMDTETKTVKLYNFDERKEIPTEVECLTALHGKDIQLAVLKRIEDKSKDNGNGKYVATGETRTVNAIAKALHPETGRTVNEYRNDVEEPIFKEEWLKKWQGKDDNRATGKTGGGAGNTGSGRPGGGGSAKKKLFGKD